MSLKSTIGIVFAGLGTLALLGLAVLAVQQRDQLAVLRQQNEALQAEVQEIEKLRTENQQAKRLQNQETELQQLRENNKELLRLRNEIRELREQQQELETLRAANAQLLQAVQSSGFLPTNQMALVTRARQKGSVLGVSVGSVNDPRLGGRSGVMVTSVIADPSGTDSGLRTGDLIRALDGHAIENPGQLQTEMLTRKPGTTVLVDVLRGNEAIRLQVTTRAWPETR